MDNWATHIEHMRQALALAECSQPEDTRKPHPRVGVVVVHSKGETTGFRGECAPGEHAEYTALIRKLRGDVPPGSTIYTTLEPCTTRRHPKQPCSEWILRSGVSRVFIGILDPNPDICGVGEWLLKSHNILVDRFPSALQLGIEALNADFIAEQRPRLLARVSTLRTPLEVRAPCVYCQHEHLIHSYVSDHATNRVLQCASCNRRFLVHMIGKGGDYFTRPLPAVGDITPVHPVASLSIPIAVRQQLKKSQFWVKPATLPGLLRLMRDTEETMVSRGERRTPYTVMQTMVSQEELLRYKVSTKCIRQFFNYLVTRGYFDFVERIPGPPRHWAYGNRFDELRAVTCYSRTCLSILLRSHVVSSLDDAVAALQFLLEDVKHDAARLAAELYPTLRRQPEIATPHDADS